MWKNSAALKAIIKAASEGERDLAALIDAGSKALGLPVPARDQQKRRRELDTAPLRLVGN
jgi:hypothetical protein